MRQEIWLPWFAVSALLALACAVFPLLQGLAPLRPAWLVLLVVFWVLRQPEHIGMGWAWCIGLLLDGFEGGMLGRHALGLVVVAYGTMVLRGRMLFYSVPQQMALVFALACADALLCRWIQGIAGRPVQDLSFLVAALLTAGLWLPFARNAQRGHLERWERPV